jgi:hypothetical protein
MTEDNREPGQMGEVGAGFTVGSEEPEALSFGQLVENALKRFGEKEQGENEVGKYGYVTYMAARDAISEYLSEGVTLDELFTIITVEGNPKDVWDSPMDRGSWDEFKDFSVRWSIVGAMEEKDPTVIVESQRRNETYGDEIITREFGVSAEQEGNPMLDMIGRMSELQSTHRGPHLTEGELDAVADAWDEGLQQTGVLAKEGSLGFLLKRPPASTDSE